MEHLLDLQTHRLTPEHDEGTTEERVRSEAGHDQLSRSAQNCKVHY
jgi:hypothetical protein